MLDYEKGCLYGSCQVIELVSFTNQRQPISQPKPPFFHNQSCKQGNEIRKNHIQVRNSFPFHSRPTFTSSWQNIAFHYILRQQTISFEKPTKSTYSTNWRRSHNTIKYPFMSWHLVHLPHYLRTPCRETLKTTWHRNTRQSITFNWSWTL